MADAVLVNSVQNTLNNTIQSFYTSPATAGGTLITAFTATNDNGSNASYKAYIFDATGVTKLAVIPQTIVVRKKASLGSPIVNQFIPPGGSLRMESSTALELVFRVSGKELT